MKMIFIIILIISYSIKINAFSIDLGVRLGANADLNHSVAINEVRKTGWEGLSAGQWSYGTGIGVFTRFNFLSWLSIIPEFHANLFKSVSSENVLRKEEGVWHTSKGRVTWNEFSLSTLISFKASWWYVSFGPGVIFSTKGSFVAPNQPRIEKEVRDHIRSSTSIIFVLDTGLNIPLRKGFLQTSIRSTVNMQATNGVINLLIYNFKPGEPLISRYEINNKLKGRSRSIMNFGFYLGYIFTFI